MTIQKENQVVILSKFQLRWFAYAAKVVLNEKLIDTIRIEEKEICNGENHLIRQ